MLFPDQQTQEDVRVKASVNHIEAADEAFHNWYRFVLAFPPHLVREYLSKWELRPNQLVLDPFCGTGTTVLESKLNAYRAVGIEMNPVAAFASHVKTAFGVEPTELVHAPRLIENQLSRNSMRDSHALTFPADVQKLLIKDSISPKPRNKVLALKDLIKRNFQKLPIEKYLLLALARIAVNVASNLRFGPEIGLGKKREDASVMERWMTQVRQMAADLSGLADPAKLPYSGVIT